MVGGLPGLVALLVAGAAVFWRIKVPQIGIEYLQKELEINRKEHAEADKDRAALRAEVASFQLRLAELDREYLHCLADREKCRRHIRDLKRQVRSLGHEPVSGDEGQH